MEMVYEQSTTCNGHLPHAQSFGRMGGISNVEQRPQQRYGGLVLTIELVCVVLNLLRTDTGLLLLAGK